jgi:hypothetical protein
VWRIKPAARSASPARGGPTACQHACFRSWPYDGHRAAIRAARASKMTRAVSTGNPSHFLFAPTSTLSPPMAAGKLPEEPRPPAHPPAMATATAAAAARLSPAPPLPFPLSASSSLAGHPTAARNRGRAGDPLAPLRRRRSTAEDGGGWCALCPRRSSLFRPWRRRAPFHCPVLRPTPRHADAHRIERNGAAEMAALFADDAGKFLYLFL